MELTCGDCILDGRPLRIDQLPELSSDDIASVVGLQAPGNDVDNADDYTWAYQIVNLDDLRCCNEDGEEPDGGWKAAYLRHQESDRAAILAGSPEYEGRAKWLEEWVANTSMYPLFVVLDDGQYRILDGYHRLAAAFWHEVKDVAVFVGSPKLVYDNDLKSCRP